MRWIRKAILILAIFYREVAAGAIDFKRGNTLLASELNCGAPIEVLQELLSI